MYPAAVGNAIDRQPIETAAYKTRKYSIPEGKLKQMKNKQLSI